MITDESQDMVGQESSDYSDYQMLLRLDNEYFTYQYKSQNNYFKEQSFFTE